MEQGDANTVTCEIYHFVVTKQDLSTMAK